MSNTNSDKDPLSETDPKIIARKNRAEARASLPAVYIDTWGLLTWKGHVRVTLGEEVGVADQYRFAFVMELEQAEQFANHLLRMIDRRRTREAEAQDHKSSSEES